MVISPDVFNVSRGVGTSASDPGAGPYSYSVFHDLDGSGRIDAADVRIALRHVNRGKLPPGEPLTPTASPPTPPARRAEETGATADLLTQTD
jgi:hypothetical protein